MLSPICMLMKTVRVFFITIVGMVYRHSKPMQNLKQINPYPKRKERDIKKWLKLGSKFSTMSSSCSGMIVETICSAVRTVHQFSKIMF